MDLTTFSSTSTSPGRGCRDQRPARDHRDGCCPGDRAWRAWFEAGPDPVYAEVRGGQPAAFVRVMLLPVAIQGIPSISYLRDEDRVKPKSQSYTVFVNEPLP